MSDNSFTEVSTESWFGRIGGAFKGILIGGVMFLLSFIILWVNEGRAVKTRKSLEEGESRVVAVSCEKVDPANDGKLVHMTGEAATGEVLRDPVFGVEAQAVKLKRTVEMFQWVEHQEKTSKKKLGGKKETTTKYTYSKEWSGKPISSGSFKKPENHENPGEFPYTANEVSAKKVTLGAFVLSPGLIGQMRDFVPLDVAKDTPVPEGIDGKVKVSGGGFYIGKKPSDPKVGDVRVKFMVVKPGTLSVIAQQTGDTFQPAPTKAGNPIEMLSAGRLSAVEMFQKAQEANKMMTWLLRLVGFLVMGFGLSLVFRPLSVIADVVPFIGSVVGAGTGFVAFLIAAGLSLVTIALAWLAYRPVFAGILFAVVAALVVLLVMKLKKGKAKQ
jgi:hypothetical protein